MAKDELYEAMKVAAKKRKIKASPEHDLYKMKDPYFFNVFYGLKDYHTPLNKKIEAGEVEVVLDISIKYHRFDELRHKIISPHSNVRFTDKIRANSVACCMAGFPRKTISFKCDGPESGVEKLCEDILDWLEKFYCDFLDSAKQEHGSLEEYYIAQEEEFPLLAGLVYIERGLYREAEACFRLPKMPGKNVYTAYTPITDEQKRRSEASWESFFGRDDRSALIDYTIAMQKGIEWTPELAAFGLLPEERN